MDCTLLLSTLQITTKEPSYFARYISFLLFEMTRSIKGMLDSICPSGHFFFGLVPSLKVKNDLIRPFTKLLKVLLTYFLKIHSLLDGYLTS